MTTPLLDSPVSVEWLEKHMLAYLGLSGEAKIVGHTGKRIGEDNGFASLVYRLDLKWDKAGEKFPQKLVLKLPNGQAFDTIGENAGMDDKPDTTFIFKFHNNECGFYDLWKREKAPVPIPKCYLSLPFDQIGGKWSVGALAMQDFSESATVWDITEALSLEHAMELAGIVGKLQAWSLNHPKEVAFAHQNVPTKGAIKNMMEGLLYEACRQMILDFPDIFTAASDNECILDLIKDYESFYYGYSAYKHLGLEPVLCHGDFWTSNILYPNNGNQVPAAILDWQMCYMGCPGQDFSRILFGFTDTEVRRKHSAKILGHFFSTLTENATKPLPYTYADIERTLRYTTKHGVVFSFLTFALVWARTGAKMGSQEKVREMVTRLKDMMGDSMELIRNTETFVVEL